MTLEFKEKSNMDVSHKIFLFELTISLELFSVTEAFS